MAAERVGLRAAAPPAAARRHHPPAGRPALLRLFCCACCRLHREHPHRSPVAGHRGRPALRRRPARKEELAAAFTFLSHQGQALSGVAYVASPQFAIRSAQIVAMAALSHHTSDAAALCRRGSAGRPAARPHRQPVPPPAGTRANRANLERGAGGTSGPVDLRRARLRPAAGAGRCAGGGRLRRCGTYSSTAAPVASTPAAAGCSTSCSLGARSGEGGAQNEDRAGSRKNANHPLIAPPMPV